MEYRLIGFKTKVDNFGAVTGFILFLVRPGEPTDNENGEICDIVKVAPPQFNPVEFKFGNAVDVTYDRLGNVRSIVPSSMHD